MNARGCLMGTTATFGTFIAVGLSIYIGAESQSWGVFFLSLIVLIACVIGLASSFRNVGRIDMSHWRAAKANCAFLYAFDGSGIAIDTTNNVIHLAGSHKSRLFERSYPMSAVRSWEFEIPGAQSQHTYVPRGARSIGASAGDGIANTMYAMDAEDRTGLRIQVRDIEIPSWFIRFNRTKNVETELRRWMEILSQSVNEGGAAMPSPTLQTPGMPAQTTGIPAQTIPAQNPAMPVQPAGNTAQPPQMPDRTPQPAAKSSQPIALGGVTTGYTRPESTSSQNAFCGKCGNAFKHDAAFCTKCGTARA